MELFNKSTGLSALFGINMLLASTAVFAAPASVEFSALIAYEGACDISVPATVIFNNGDDILPSQIEAGNTAAKKTFDLTLANCQGVGVTPKIIVAGTSTTDYGEGLFLDTVGSTSVGYGILLQTDGNAAFKKNLNLAASKKISAIDGWNTGTSLTTINGIIPMTAVLSCGNCTTDGRIGGELKANVTFDFQYD